MQNTSRLHLPPGRIHRGIKLVSGRNPPEPDQPVSRPSHFTAPQRQQPRLHGTRGGVLTLGSRRCEAQQVRRGAFASLCSREHNRQSAPPPPIHDSTAPIPILPFGKGIAAARGAMSISAVATSRTRRPSWCRNHHTPVSSSTKHLDNRHNSSRVTHRNPSWLYTGEPGLWPLSFSTTIPGSTRIYPRGCLAQL